MSVAAAIAYSIVGFWLAIIAGATAIGPTQPGRSGRSVDLTRWREPTGGRVAIAVGACVAGAVALHVLGPLPTTAVPLASRDGRSLSVAIVGPTAADETEPAMARDQIAVILPAEAALGDGPQSDPSYRDRRAMADPELTRSGSAVDSETPVSAASQNAPLRLTRASVSCAARSCAGPKTTRHARSTRSMHVGLPAPDRGSQPASPAIGVNSGEALVQTPNSLPPGFQVGTPAYEYARSVERYYRVQANRLVTAQAPRRPNGS